jgi:hypothetical protein
MDENKNEHSGLERAVNTAHTASSFARIAKAAASGGMYGAAAATAKEAFPFLVKVAVAVLTVLIVVPMLVFTALPNIFFGYDTAESESVIQMTGQAMTLGNAYMTMEDFENSQIDAVVTSITGEYADDGVEIDEIVVQSDFDEDDLNWFIAINSVAYQQDLNVMTAESVRQMSTSRLSYQPSLDFLNGDGDIVKTTLTITIDKLEPDVWMDALGFEDEDRTWAGALYETLSESDALNQYAPYFAAYSPNYGGDTSYSGDTSHGESYSNSIDISGFTDPSTKNNRDLAAYAIQAWENNWGYVWGTYGNVLTESLFAYKLAQYPDGVGNYKEFIQENWLGHRTTDCIGLVKGYGWLDPDTLSIRYGTNGMPDYGANQMYQTSKNLGTENGTILSMPEIPGLILWKEGHTGVYIGNGYAIEAMGTKYGVVKTKVDGRGWQAWYKLPYITYMDGD